MKVVSTRMAWRYLAAVAVLAMALGGSLCYPSFAVAAGEDGANAVFAAGITTQDATHISYSFGNEYSGNLSGYGTGNATHFDFTISEKSHLHSVVTTTSKNYRLEFYNTAGNCVSDWHATNSVTNSLGTSTTHSHSVDLEPGAYSLAVWKTGNGAYAYSMVTTSEPIITLGGTSISSATNSSAGAISVTTSDVSGALGYEFQIADNPSFTDAVTVTSPTPSITKDGLKRGATYYVQARAFAAYSDGLAVYGAWSRASSAYVSAPTIGATSIMAASSPSYGAIKVNLASVAEADSYEYRVGKSSNLDEAEISKSSTVEFTKSGLDMGTTYYVQARAHATIDGMEIYSSWCPAQAVYVSSPTVGETSIVSAVNSSFGAVRVGVAPVEGVDFYEYRIGKNTDLEGAEVRESSSAEFTVDGLDTGVTYYVQARAHAAIAGMEVRSAWCQAQSVYVSMPDNSVAIVTKSKTLKRKALKKKAKSFSIVAEDEAGTILTYKLISVSPKAKKYVKLNESTGVVKVRKGIKKGKYQLRVSVSAAATPSYQAASSTGVITLKVK